MRNTKPVPKTFDELKAYILSIQQEAVAEWMDRHSDEDIKERVHEILNEDLKSAALSLLGFDNRWGRWELQNNQKASAAQQYINSKVEQAFKEWADNLIITGIKRLPKKAIAQSLMQGIEKQFENTLRRKLNAAIEDITEKTVDSLVKQLSTNDLLQNQSALNKILTG
jgi:protoporphyrinogen oxidase